MSSYLRQATGRAEPSRGENGATWVVQTLAGAVSSRNRESALSSSRVTFTWAEAIKELTVLPQPSARASDLSAALTAAVLCFDAPDDTTADSWLTSGTFTSTDSNRFIVPAGLPRTFYFSGDGITRVDAIQYSSSGDAMTLFLEAA